MTKRQRTAKLYAKIRKAHPWWSAKRSRRYRSRWLEVVAIFTKRSRAAKKGARTKAVAKQLEQQQAALPKRVRDTEEWELTFRYSKKGKAIGWTMRIVAPRGTSREIIQLVARRRGQGQTEP